MFDILCNGVALLRDFDVYKAAGGSNRSLRKTFRNLTPNHQSKIVFSMVPNKNFPIVNALMLTDASR